MGINPAGYPADSYYGSMVSGSGAPNTANAPNTTTNGSGAGGNSKDAAGAVSDPLAAKNPAADKNADKVTISSTKGKDANGKDANSKDAKSKENDQKIQSEVQKLKATEQHVISHELAHQSVGGRYAGAPSYQYTKGPDGKSYINGGEVSIDVSKAKDPEETLTKMRQVRAAAMAPSDPSPQDQSVAQKASQIEVQAQQEIAQKRFVSSGGKSSGANPTGTKPAESTTPGTKPAEPSANKSAGAKSTENKSSGIKLQRMQSTYATNKEPAAQNHISIYT
jgi:hypothetical protein